MEYFYQILTAKNLINTVFTYKSTEFLSIGQLVLVSVRNSLYHGIVLSEISKNLNSKYEVKAISKILPVILSKEQLQFMQIFATNTFSSLNNVLTAMTRPLKMIETKKNLEILEKEFLNSQNLSSKETRTNLNTKFEYFLEIDISLRIIYLIRNIISDLQAKNRQSNPTQETDSQIILLIFPEQKMLDKIASEIIKNDDLQKEVQNKLNLEFLFYNGIDNKNNKKVVMSLLSKRSFFQVSLIFTTRSGIFLPYNLNGNFLSNVILIDEANSLYIQELNNLYFDTRDSSYFFAHSYGANLFFVSRLPSVRLYNFQKSQTLEKLNQLQSKNLESRQIFVTQKNYKADHYELFSTQIEEILKPDTDTILID